MYGGGAKDGPFPKGRKKYKKRSKLTTNQPLRTPKHNFLIKDYSLHYELTAAGELSSKRHTRERGMTCFVSQI